MDVGSAAHAAAAWLASLVLTEPAAAAVGLTSRTTTGPPAATSACSPHLPSAAQLLPPLEAHALPRLLHPCAPAALYRRRESELKTVVHWGQRKLLLSEVEVLSMALSLAARLEGPQRTISVLYAGAAPGTHVELLSQLFPEVLFVLVDPAPFRVQPTSRICLRQEFFSCQLAAEFSPAKRPPDELLVFLSDVRTADFRISTAGEVEADVAADMARQLDWVRELQPDIALLKLRLPWSPGTTEYLAGAVMLPVWGPPTTSEGRLLCLHRRHWHLAFGELAVAGTPAVAGPSSGGSEGGNRTPCIHLGCEGAGAGSKGRGGIFCGGCAFPAARWDNDTYCNQMYFHNLHTRLRPYRHAALAQSCYRGPPNRDAAAAAAAGGGIAATVQPPAPGVGLDACYDCAAETAVLGAYLRCVPHAAGVVRGLLARSGDGATAPCCGGAPQCPLTLRRLVDAISAGCSGASGRTLASGGLPTGDAKALWFPSRRFDEGAGVISEVDPEEQRRRYYGERGGEGGGLRGSR